MGRIYSASYSGTITAAGGDTDLMEFLPAANKPIKLRGIEISQISEVGDAQEEGLRITVKRLAATVTSGNGSAVTPAPMDSADIAAGCAVEANGATVATTSGATTTLIDKGWNNRASFEWWAPDDRFAPKAKNGEALVIRMETTLADDMTAQITAWFEEE